MNPVAFTVGPLEVRWYSLCILAAAITGLFVMEKEAGRFGIRKDFIFNMMFWTFIVGILGARVYYVLFNLSQYQSNPIDALKIWNGGLAIHGGILAGLVTVIMYCKKYRVRTIRIIDIIAPALLLCQTIGRWGNFFNQEAHGAATTAETLHRMFMPDFIVNGMTIDGVTYMPSFLFESIFCLIAFILIAFIRRGKYIKVSQPTALYLMSYGVIRFIIEIGRTDSLMLGGFKMAQIISVIFFIIGISIMAYTSKKGKFEDLYNDPSNVDEIRF